MRSITKRITWAIHERLAKMAMTWVEPPQLRCETDPQGLNAPVIFIMESHSLIDYALLRRALSSLGAARIIDWQHKPEELSLELTPGSREPIYLLTHLFQPKTIFNRWRRSSHHHLEFDELLQAIFGEPRPQRPPYPWKIVPVFFFWSKEPQHFVPTTADRIFGSSYAPGYLRKLAQFALNRSELKLYIGEPIADQEISAVLAGPKPEIRWQRLRKLCARALVGLRRVATGPMQKWKSRIVELTLRDEHLTHTMNLLAKRDGTTLEEQKELARSMLYEIAAEYSVPHTGVLDWLLKHLYNIWYDGLYVDMKGLNAVRQAAAAGHPLILLPTHKSHMDYLIISKIFFTHGMHPPHIAAGVNLSFWPFGYLFRRSGAFFIRRKIQNDLLYARVLEAYIYRLIREGYNQEFFIEGGRSRDGKLLPPKLGILRITVEAFLNQACEDLQYIPIAIGYDKVIEDSSYMRESLGAPKEKESFLKVLRIFRKVRHRHGSICVEFHQPISLKKLHDEMLSKGSDVGKKQITAELTTRVVRGLSQANPVTPTSLVAMSMLAKEKEFHADEIERNVMRLISLLQPKEVRLSPKFTDVGQAVRQSLQRYYQFKTIRRAASGESNEWTIPPPSRLLLAYYKNMSLHHFLPEALLCTAFKADTADISREQLHTRFEFLISLLAREFIELADPNVSAAGLLESAEGWFIKHSFLSKKGGRYQNNRIASTEVYHLLRSSLRPFFEAELTCLDYQILYHNNVPKEPEPLKLIQHWHILFRQGIVKLAESISHFSLLNAWQTIEDFVQAEMAPSSKRIDYCHKLRERILEVVDSPKGSTPSKNPVLAIGLPGEGVIDKVSTKY